ncbi:Hypothetical protein GbCGDNIH2_7113 [Granulibacter bethesdensis]|nr:Hypothetical protein GbCGDNIH2_7113 [Granulibacter bethesdensis]
MSERPAPRQYGGLSPRTRRNLDTIIPDTVSLRSISAHAEEPSVTTGDNDEDEVYLRARGGTPYSLNGCI